MRRISCKFSIRVHVYHYLIPSYPVSHVSSWASWCNNGINFPHLGKCKDWKRPAWTDMPLPRDVQASAHICQWVMRVQHNLPENSSVGLANVYSPPPSPYFLLSSKEGASSKHGQIQNFFQGKFIHAFLWLNNSQALQRGGRIKISLIRFNP